MMAVLFEAPPEGGARCAENGEADSVCPVVRRFLGDLHVVYVRFAYARRGDFNELSLAAHFADGAASTIAHRSTDAPNKLVNDGDDTALIGHSAFDTFGHKFVGVIGRVLEVAIGRAVCHGAYAAHAAIRLVRTTLIQDNVAGGLFGTRKHPTHHAGGSTGRQRF